MMKLFSLKKLKTSIKKHEIKNWIIKWFSKTKFLVVLLLALIAVLSFAAYKHNSVVASSFTKTTLASGLSRPTSFAQVPDGRVFLAEKRGVVRVLKNGSLLSDPLLAIPVDTADERGLIGITADPNFSSNNYIYVTYTSASPLELRVSRFTVNGDTASPGSEFILLKSSQPCPNTDPPQNLCTVHHGGTLKFGPDGKLWISVGNNSIPNNSQDLSTIHGKLLRINSDGTIPTDNPFYNQSGKRGEIYAYGLRNPFKFSFLPDGRPILGDVGDFSWEEINIIERGGNYGYPLVEGNCASDCPYINPVYVYSHNGGSASVIGGFMYTASQFPEQYRNTYFFADFALGFIKSLVLDNGNFVSEQIVDDQAGFIVDLQQGPDGSVYYLTLADQSFTPFSGSLTKLSFDPNNQPPVAKIQASPKTGNAPLSVNFSGTGSTDPQGRPLTYSWDFGDAQTGAGENVNHVYNSQGVYKAKLTVSNGTTSVTSESVEIVVGYQYPSASITEPSEGVKYNAGTVINFAGEATDAQDGTLPASAYSWDIVFHHQTHIHPHLGPVDGVKNGTFEIPSTGETSHEVWYEVKLTVTNSLGLKTTVTRNIYPNTVDITLDTQPQGLQLTLDGVPQVTPKTVKGVVGAKRSLGVSTPQLLGSTSYDFQSWSDNGAQNHTVTTPNVDTIYKANFKDVGDQPGNIRVRIAEFAGTDWQNKFINGATVKLTNTDGSTVFATATSQSVNNEEGWAVFDNLTPGTYGLMAYKPGYSGVWKKISCQSPSGSFENATIVNSNTELFTAAWNNSAKVVTGVTTFCQDLGLTPTPNGSISMQVIGYDYGNHVSEYINGATVKLTDTSGGTVIAEAVSAKRQDAQDGWVTFTNLPAGTYGLMAYKSGYNGYLKKIDCNVEETKNATIKNQNTEGKVAAWNNSVVVTGGVTTFCRDLGLKKVTQGRVYIRIGEFNSGGWANKYINGVTVKLTGRDGSVVFRESLSQTMFTSENGWVELDNVDEGTYGVLAYKSGYKGVWKKLDCASPGGSFDNASIQNNNTGGMTAAWNDTVIVLGGQTTWCTDLGLQESKGSIAIRVAELGPDNGWINKYLNDATVKLTDQSGTVTVATLATKKEFGTEDGWAIFDGIEAGTYGLLSYKSGYEGVWKKLNCSAPEGSFSNASIQNANTGNLKAAWNNAATVQSGQITWCQDLGLKSISSAKGNIRVRVAEFQNNTYQGKFLNDVTVKLTDTSGNTVFSARLTSPRPNGDAGWADFENVDPGTYGILAYKSGYDGVWKKISCDLPQGDFNNASIQNSNTEGLKAAWNNDIVLAAGQTIYCRDLGLQASGTASLSVPAAGPGPVNNSEATSGAEIKNESTESTGGAELK
jgi:glucose/arabinose dehydrogenase